MNRPTLNIAAKEQFAKWIADTQIGQGLIEVDVDTALSAFVTFSNVPVSKGLFGRMMTGMFLKRQNRKTFKQCYFLNRSF